MNQYRPTHRSKLDGSEAQVIGRDDDLVLLVNENGDTWEDAASDWERIK